MGSGASTADPEGSLVNTELASAKVKVSKLLREQLAGKEKELRDAGKSDDDIKAELSEGWLRTRLPSRGSALVPVSVNRSVFVCV